MVLVDTPVWSLALRRRTIDLSPSDTRLTQALYQLVQQHRVSLLGSTRQEILSGIREETQFRRIREYLRDFSDVGLDSTDYEEAARCSNRCRSAGVTGSQVDMLICSVSLRHNWEIFTTDSDFVHYRRVLQIRLLGPLS
jgi:predicted nucleic acid-binding protein